MVKTIVLPVLSLPSPAARFCLPSKCDLRNICYIVSLSLALRSPLFFPPLRESDADCLSFQGCPVKRGQWCKCKAQVRDPQIMLENSSLISRIVFWIRGSFVYSESETLS